MIIIQRITRLGRMILYCVKTVVGLNDGEQVL